MEEIIKRYLSVENELSKITDELYNIVNDKYHNRIINCKTVEELDNVYEEIKNIVPNSLPLYMMFILIKEQKQKING